MLSDSQGWNLVIFPTSFFPIASEGAVCRVTLVGGVKWGKECACHAVWCVGVEGARRTGRKCDCGEAGRGGLKDRKR